MKVICTLSSPYLNLYKLTLYKIYLAQKSSVFSDQYTLQNDEGYIDYAPIMFFKTINEFRDEQINKII